MKPTAVLGGSFRRDLSGLESAYKQLLALGVEITSPKSLDFVDTTDGFARTQEEMSVPSAQVEAMHLKALQAAHFIWLHVPSDGHVGVSAALEIGSAQAWGVPVYATSYPKDITIREFVTVVDSPAIALEHLSGTKDKSKKSPIVYHPRTPSIGLKDMQDYYERMSTIRGFEKESPQDTMLLLTEEIGELARAVRLHVKLSRAVKKQKKRSMLDILLGRKRKTVKAISGIEAELADVQLYILHLANVLGIDLSKAVTNKELSNHSRYNR